MNKTAWGIVLVLAGGLAAGALDIAYAMVFWSVKAGVSPQRILHSVAAGVLGTNAFEGGLSTAVLGLLLHFFIAICMAVAYYLAARQQVALVRHPLVAGTIYGLLLYVVMNFVVVPLSAANPGSRNLTWIVMTIGAHVVLVGMPIALATRRALTGSLTKWTGPRH